MRSPIPLTVRYDSLLVQCCIAAAIYYGPIDAGIGALTFFNGRAYSNSINKPVDIKDPKSAVEKFCAKKGLSVDDFNVSQGSTWKLKHANAYN